MFTRRGYNGPSSDTLLHHSAAAPVISLPVHPLRFQFSVNGCDLTLSKRNEEMTGSETVAVVDRPEASALDSAGTGGRKRQGRMEGLRMLVWQEYLNVEEVVHDRFGKQNDGCSSSGQS